MKRLFFKANEIMANNSGVMESRDHFKNGASSKSQTSRMNVIIVCLVVIATVFSSCSTISHYGMREPNVRVELNKADFTLSKQVSAESWSTLVFGIDFGGWFTKKTGSLEKDGEVLGYSISFASIPVIGNISSDETRKRATKKALNNALFELMKENPNYDVVFYPQYEIESSHPFLLGAFYNTTTVKVTARLGKLNDSQ
jgi:hypothetical protein